MAAAVIAIPCICCRRQVVASKLILATYDFVAIAHAIAVRISNNYSAVAITDFTCIAIRVDTCSCIGCCCIIVASVHLLTADNLICVTNAIVVGIVVYDNTCTVCLT